MLLYNVHRHRPLQAFASRRKLPQPLQPRRVVVILRSSLLQCFPRRDVRFACFLMLGQLCCIYPTVCAHGLLAISARAARAAWGSVMRSTPWDAGALSFLFLPPSHCAETLGPTLNAPCSQLVSSTGTMDRNFFFDLMCLAHFMRGSFCVPHSLSPLSSMQGLGAVAK